MKLKLSSQQCAEISRYKGAFRAIEELWNYAIELALNSTDRVIKDLIYDDLNDRNEEFDLSLTVVHEVIRYLNRFHIYFFDLYKKNSSTLSQGFYYGVIEALRIIRTYVLDIQFTPLPKFYVTKSLNKKSIEIPVQHIYVFSRECQPNTLLYVLRWYEGGFKIEEITRKAVVDTTSFDAIYQIVKTHTEPTELSAEHYPFLLNILIQRGHLLQAQKMSEYWGGWLRRGIIYLQLGIEKEQIESKITLYKKYVKIYIDLLKELKLISAKKEDINDIMITLLEQEKKTPNALTYTLSQYIKYYSTKLHGETNITLPEQSTLKNIHHRISSPKSTVQEKDENSINNTSSNSSAQTWTSYLKGFLFTEDKPAPAQQLLTTTIPIVKPSKNILVEKGKKTGRLILNKPHEVYGKWGDWPPKNPYFIKRRPQEFKLKEWFMPPINVYASIQGPAGIGKT